MSASRGPGSSSRRPRTSTVGSCGPQVVAVGPTVRNVEEDDRVLFAPDSGYEVEIRGDEYLILRERDVHAVASTRSEGQTGLYL